jgi:hypothetical protein
MPLSEAYLLLDSFKHLLATGDAVKVRQDLRDWIAWPPILPPGIVGSLKI